MRLTFLGAAETVTGSKYLLEHQGKKILVDCGLFQGQKELRQRNWQEFFINPKNIDAVILTHAHIDHSGYIPLLVKNGFRGHIFCSAATFDLCKILLADSGFLQEEDARRANKYHYSKHNPALPLYTEEDARASFKLFHVVNFGEAHYFDENFYFTLSHSGHILGASFVSIFFEDKSLFTKKSSKKTLTFSGDLGRACDPIVKAPAQLQHTDYLVIESTYGNRLHENTDPTQILQDVINRTAARGGKIIIPSFAVGRAQNILLYLYQLKQQKAIADIPIFLDSPMAINASEILQKYPNEHKLGKNLCNEICDIAKYVRTAEESKKLNDIKMPIIIISASGMAEGGRILHHLRNNISNHLNTILFTGFQVEGTRGEKILHGEKYIKIHGLEFEVNAEIASLSGTSAHADYEEILQWLKNLKSAPKKTFITHGTYESASALQKRIKEVLGWNSIMPKYLQSEKL